MSASPRPFREDLALTEGLLEQRQVAQGVFMQSSRTVSEPARELLLRRLTRQLQARSAKRAEAVSRLINIIRKHDPVTLLMRVAEPTTAVFSGSSRESMAMPESVTWPAKVEYLFGLALTHAPGNQTPTSETVLRVTSLVSDIFDAESAQRFLDMQGQFSERDSDVGEVSYLLQQEKLFDRMNGYPRHLEVIDAEIFDRHRDHYVRAIGFNPADLVRITRRRTAACQRRVDDVRRAAARPRRGETPNHPEVVKEGLRQAIYSLRVWEVEDVAEDCDLPVAEVAAALSFCSTTWGSQPNFRLPIERNLARTHPLVRLGDSTFLIPDPWSLAVVAHERLQQDSVVQKKYLMHRQRGHERLILKALQSVFSAASVKINRHYVSASAGPGEIDALVSLGWPLVVEGKSHSLTARGRDGYVDRVKRVTEAVVQNALNQTQRAHDYIMKEGGRSFSDRQGGPEKILLPQTVVGDTEVIVVFERMDPIAMLAANLVEEVGRAVWVLSIADLLMVVDILPSRALFHHYAKLRARATAAGLRVYVEADALGAYIAGHLLAIVEQVERTAVGDEDKSTMMGYFSDDINDHFTKQELGMLLKRPHPSVPQEVLEGLEAADAMEPTWTAAVDTVLAAPAVAWKRWRSYRARHRDGTFLLSPQVHLQLSDTPSYSSVGGVTTLGVCRKGSTTGSKQPKVHRAHS